MDKKVKIGIVQFESKLGDVEFNINKAVGMIEELASQGADIVCLPELFATGYDLIELKDSILDLSVEYYEIIKKAMSESAKKNEIYLIAPFGEIKKGKTGVYNSAFVFDEDGNCMGSYAKSHLWGMEKSFFEEGNNLPVFETRFGKIGILICYDAGFPEPSRVMCLKGAEILFYPAAWREEEEDVWELNIRQRALENVIFTCGVNRFDPSNKTKLFGGSKISNPRGRIIHDLPRNEEATGVFEINLDEIGYYRNEINYLGDRKPFMYKKIID
jgi:predicted amidohydrolase